MNTHQNARLTVWGRAQAVQRVLVEGEPIALVAAAFHVTPPTIRKYVRRYEAEGPPGLLDRSSRPHRSPCRTPPAVVAQIVQLRTQRQTGPEIAAQLTLPRSTVGRILQHLGLGRLRTGPDTPRPRYERAHPGELLHVDLKGLPRFVTVGHRIHGQRSKVGRATGLGQDYLHVAIDDATRLAHAEVLPAQDGPACAAFLARAGAWFAALGIPIQRVMTDNAWAYCSRPMQHALQGLGARHLRTRPYSPQTNGKAERFIQSCLREWAYKQPYPTSRQRAAALPGYLERYNTQREHSALGQVPPLFAYLMRTDTTS